MNKDKTTWQRRKHTSTKPNWIVRSTYNTVDWFGDFNGLKRSAANWIRRSILKVVDITILLCLFAFSAIHSFEMLQKFGITGVTQWLAIIFFEVNFLYSSIALDIAKKNGEPLGSRRAMFYICLAFVEASNVTALWNGWTLTSFGGVLVGGVMPIMLLLKKESYKKKSTTKDSQTEKQPALQMYEVTNENIEPEPEEIIEENPPSEPIEPITLEDEKTDDISPEIIEENSPEIIDKKEQPAPEKNDEITHDTPEENTPEIIAENTIENEPEKVDEITPEKADKKKQDKPKRRKSSSTKKKSRKSSKKTVPNYEAILAIAEKLKNDETIDANQLEKEIEKAADCSKYFAKKALAELKKKETKKAAEKEEVFDKKNERKLALVQ